MAEKSGKKQKHVCNVSPCCTVRFPELQEAVGPFMTRNPSPEEHRAQLAAHAENERRAKANARKLRGTGETGGIVTHGVVGFKNKDKDK